MNSIRDPMEIFQRTEAYIERHMNQGYPEPSDYTIRFCEATVANFAGYTDRVQWITALREKSDNSVYLDILRDMEAYRQKHEHEDIPYIRVVHECQFRIARHLCMFDWRERLRQERLEASEIIFRLPLLSSSQNDTIIAACKEKGIDDRYNRLFQLEVNWNGVWGRVDTICRDGLLDVYFLPLDEMKKEKDRAA